MLLPYALEVSLGQSKLLLSRSMQIAFVILVAGQMYGKSVWYNSGLLLESSHILFVSTYAGEESIIVCSPIWVNVEQFYRLP